MRHASGHNYRNSSFIVDVAMGQIPRSTERISSYYYYYYYYYCYFVFLKTEKINVLRQKALKS